MRRELPGGFELDDDRARIDLDAVHEYLAHESYWARGRPRETVEQLVHSSQRIVGLYRGDRLIGFCRAVTDGVTVVYLADVYVLPEFRGRGLGLELVRFSVDEGPYADRKWLLHTQDAHSLYETVGFGRPTWKTMERDPLRRAES